MLLNFAEENTSNSYHTSPTRRNKSVFQSELYSLHVLFSSPLILCWKLEGFFFKFVAVSLKSEALKKNIKKSLFFSNLSPATHFLWPQWKSLPVIEFHATWSEAVRFLSLVTRV